MWINAVQPDQARARSGFSRMVRFKRHCCAGLLLLASALAGCSSLPREAATTGPIYDPYEATNRAVLRSNQAVLGPLARTFHAVTPGPLRDRLADLDSNLKEPRIFANDLLQLRFGAAGKTAGRFMFNSVFGIGGLYDLASHEGLPQQTGDFGQTLFTWGVNDGPYLVLPFFGPSTSRDAIGLAVDSVADPVNWAVASQVGHYATIGLSGLDFISQIDQLKQAEDSSVDFYSFLRSAYYQTRRAQLREAIGLPPAVETPDDIK
jgi:phospholipid-binding lipoprotein MlaA